ncbi:MAG: carboxypeptidase-like regulatory domain-containing protein [Hymenobacter sp.]
MGHRFYYPRPHENFAPRRSAQSQFRRRFGPGPYPPVSAQAPTPAPTRLRGTVLDAAGRPLPGANVFLKTTFDGATTDSLGRFDFSTTAAGSLPLVITLIGYEMQEAPLTLLGGLLALPPAGCGRAGPRWARS